MRTRPHSVPHQSLNSVFAAFQQTFELIERPWQAVAVGNQRCCDRRRCCGSECGLSPCSTVRHYKWCGSGGEDRSHRWINLARGELEWGFWNKWNQILNWKDKSNVEFTLDVELCIECEWYHLWFNVFLVLFRHAYFIVFLYVLY